jgi:hypothetical protein
MKHYCERCGLESACGYSGWPDRHPTAAVFAGLGLGALVLLFASFLIAAIAAYPMAALGFGLLVAVGGAGALQYRDDKRLKAVARRFDWERELP